MSAIADKLRAIRVFNTHDLLLRFADEGQDVACCYTGPEPRRVTGGGTHVYSPSHHTAPGAAWYCYGRKTFAGNLAETMPLALAWASEKYGVTEWAVDPTDRSARVPKVVRDLAVEATRGK